VKLSYLDVILDRRRALINGVAALFGLFVFSAGWGEGGDRLMRMMRDGLRNQSASGQIHVVEIDARSLREIDRWPWPRRNHARLIDRLTASQVHSIAFDIDFSSLSSPADDSALAAALRRANGSVILPTFRQRAGGLSSEFIDNLPAKIFREHSFLGAVTVHPGPDGYVRQMPLGIRTAGTPRPSLASLIAEQQAEIDRSYEIDYSIDPSTIPRHSFVDVLLGRVDPAKLAGKRIIVGATAVEMGDRYVVPRHGVIPGVLIQAIAAETLLAGAVPNALSGFWPLLIALSLIALTVRAGNRRRRMYAFGIGSAMILALPLATEELLALSMPLAPAVAALVAAAALAFAGHIAERFRHRAFFDQETGLPNLPALTRDAGAQAGPIVVARIDRFAAIAAGLGTEATIRLIHRVADRISFGRNQKIYRIDESSLAWIEADDEEAELAERLEALVALMRSPIDCGRLVDVSLGLGVAGPVAGGPKQQVANAALAAVHALRLANRWEWFSDEATDETDWHLSLLGELDAAMERGEVWNAYQPKLDLQTEQICGVEALVRWNHPKRGPIAPDQFIPLLEEHGRARDLTFHVFEQAIEDVRSWQAQGQSILIAINVSATLLLDSDFVSQLRDKLARTDFSAGTITIEVTESAAMIDEGRAIAALESWRSAGANISIDDYGSGQSSLGYLQKLPASELKIDKSFVTDLVNDRRNEIMVRSTIALAHELGMAVVAEGVEDEACLARLTEMGCDLVQGWHIGRPMPARALADFLTQQRAIAA
jgi:diguanylate cyclase